MSWRRTLSRLLGIGRRDTRDAELRREIDAHLALIEDEYRRDGLSEGEARARARRAFGNVTVARERSEDAWSFPRLDTLDASVASSLGARRMTLILLAFFAVVSLVLAALGLYAATSHGVAQRAREIGIRMALGADGGRVVSLILRDGLRVTAFGLAAGIPAAVAATRLIRAQLYGVSPADPVVLGSVAALLGLVSIVAALVPARRAVRIDPLIAMKPE